MAQMRTNVKVLQGVIDWNTRNPVAKEHMQYHVSEFMNAAEKLENLLSRTQDITRCLNSAMRQVRILSHS